MNRTTAKMEKAGVRPVGVVHMAAPCPRCGSNGACIVTSDSGLVRMACPHCGLSTRACVTEHSAALWWNAGAAQHTKEAQCKR